MIGQKVLVTTEFRGVFFGEVIAHDLPNSITLRRARNCIYWDSSVGGFLGLAATGPGPGCRIGAVADELTLWHVTSVSRLTDQATAAWESAPCYG